MNFEEIQIKRVIMHVLDNQLTVPVLAKQEMVTGISMKEYFAGHICKVANDDSLQMCVFNSRESSPFMSTILDFQNDPQEKFIKSSSDLAVMIFDIMAAHINIPSADVAFVEYKVRDEQYMAILKINFDTTYTHFAEEDGGIVVVPYKTTLPAPTKKIKEAIIIDLKTMEIQLVEQAYELDGVKDYYLSKLLLRCTTQLSSKGKMAAIEGAKNSIIKKFYGHDPEKAIQINRQLYDYLSEGGNLKIKEFAEAAFQNEEVTEYFENKLDIRGVRTSVVELEEKTVTRTFKTQKIGTKNDIKVELPRDIFSDPNRFELQVSETGTINMIIRDIGDLK